MLQIAGEIIALVFIVGVGIAIAISTSKTAAEDRKKEAKRFREFGFYELDPHTHAGCAAFPGLTSATQAPWVTRFLSEFEKVTPFNRGASRTVHRTFQKAAPNRTTTYLHYSYSVSTGKASATYSFSVFIVEWGLKFPFLAVREEGFIDRAAKFVGVQDIQFEDVEFNERFNVQCESAEFAYAFLHPLMMERMKSECVMSYTLIGDRVLMVFDSGDPIHHIESIERLLSIFEELIPDYLEQDHRAPFVQGESSVTQGAQRLGLQQVNR